MDADLEKIVQEYANQCGPHDFGLVEFGCGCAPGDYRPVVLELVRQLQERREECARLSQLLLDAQPETKEQIDAFLRGDVEGVRRERPARRVPSQPWHSTGDEGAGGLL